MSKVSNETGPAMFYGYEHVFSILVSAFTILVGVPGNALVLWITGVKMERTVTTIWFGNLALADITCSLFLPFMLVQSFSHFVCQIVHFILFLSMFAGIFTMMAISIDRWILVVHPVWARNHRRVKVAWIICLAIWALAITLCLPVATYQRPNNFDNKIFCYLEFHMITSINLTCAIFGFLIPLIIICICYIHLAFKVQNVRFLEVGRKTILVAISIIAVFFITWAPYHIIGIILLYTGNEVLFILSLLSQSLTQINICVNPILYVFMGKDMKQKLRRSIGELMENIFRENLLTPPCSENQHTTEEGLPY